MILGVCNLILYDDVWPLSWPHEVGLGLGLEVLARLGLGLAGLCQQLKNY